MTTATAQRVYVIADSRLAFEDYCHAHDLPNRSAPSVVWVHRVDQLRGLSGADVRVVEGAVLTAEMQAFVDLARRQVVRAGEAQLAPWAEALTEPRRTAGSGLGHNEAMVKGWCPGCKNSATLWLWLEKVELPYDGHLRRVSLSGVVTDVVHDSNEAAGSCPGLA
jgi:hypothetical protein